MEECRSKITVFQDLHAWQEGHKLVLMVYDVTCGFPKEEMYGLTSQMRRCSVSVTSNIAEAFSRQSFKEKVQFYSMAHGSLTELQNQLIISKDIRLLASDKFSDMYEQSILVHKLLSGLIKKSKSIIHNS